MAQAARMTSFQSGRRQLEGYIARPEGDGPFPGIVVIREFGPNPFDRFMHTFDDDGERVAEADQNSPGHTYCVSEASSDSPSLQRLHYSIEAFIPLVQQFDPDAVFWQMQSFQEWYFVRRSVSIVRVHHREDDGPSRGSAEERYSDTLREDEPDTSV